MRRVTRHAGTKLVKGAGIPDGRKLKRVNCLGVVQIVKNCSTRRFIRGHPAPQEVGNRDAGDDQDNAHNDQQFD